MAFATPKNPPPQNWQQPYIKFRIVEQQQEVWSVVILVVNQNSKPPDHQHFINVNYSAGVRTEAFVYAAGLAKKETGKEVTNTLDGMITCNWTWRGCWMPMYGGI